MAKIVSAIQAAEYLSDSATVMVGGFLGVGTPEIMIDAMVEKGFKNLTIITSDTAYPDRGVGRLIVGQQVKKVIASHVGTNPETGKQMHAKQLEVELSPQGTLVERIRSGGAGLGGVLTPTGLGTIVAEDKPIIVIDGKNFLLEKPLRAQVALLKAFKADLDGNLVFRKATRNFNPVMATAADVVIVEVQEIVQVGAIDPDEVVVPGIFVDYIVQG